MQDKVWVTGAGEPPREVYTVKADARPDPEGHDTDPAQARETSDAEDEINTVTRAQPATM